MSVGEGEPITKKCIRYKLPKNVKNVQILRLPENSKGFFFMITERYLFFFIKNRKTEGKTVFTFLPQWPWIIKDFIRYDKPFSKIGRNKPLTNW